MCFKIKLRSEDEQPRKNIDNPVMNVTMIPLGNSHKNVDGKYFIDK